MNNNASTSFTHNFKQFFENARMGFTVEKMSNANNVFKVLDNGLDIGMTLIYEGEDNYLLKNNSGSISFNNFVYEPTVDNINKSFLEDDGTFYAILCLLIDDDGLVSKILSK